MTLKKFLKSEKGSVTIMVALTMTALMGFAALAVDYGTLTNERSLLQNAADAAALAGVVEGEGAANAYVDSNTAGTVTKTITKPTNDTMTVSLEKEVGVNFAQLLTGRTSETVAVTATAIYGKEIESPGYAIWAEDEIELKNKTVINGNIHSVSGNFNPDDMGDIPEGEEEAKITINGSKTSGSMEMPDYSYLLDGSVWPLDYTKYEKGGKIEFKESDLQYLDPDVIYYIDSEKDVVFKKGCELKISLIAKGNIKFNGSGAGVEAKVLYSVNGDITLNGSGGDLRVLAYAPNGDITWNGSGTELRGAIIAKNFSEHGSEAGVTYDENVLGEFARIVPQLIE